MNKKSSWIDIDKEQNWHPYSNIKSPGPVFPVVSANGAKIQLADGRELIDGMSSWWAAIHGYNHPRLNQALLRQSKKMTHVMFGGLAHEPAANLTQLLTQITPCGLDYVFYSDSGSVSVEVAMKMALQYHVGQGDKERKKFLTFRGGYHGDTLGAMSVCDPVTGMHSLFNSVLAQQIFASRPTVKFGGKWDSEDFDCVRTLAHENAEELVGIIVEPVVQGAGGMWFYHPDYLDALGEICKELGILLIYDEIATGFGRTGKLFAAEYANVIPDIMCLGKALTGGYMSLAATLCTDKVANKISSSEPGVFMHGPTFMANPLSCATALESVKMLLESDWSSKVREIEKQLASELAPAKSFNSVKDVRTMGAIGVIELTKDVDMSSIPHEFVNRGVWLRPFGRLIYTMPAYSISKHELRSITTSMVEVASMHL